MILAQPLAWEKVGLRGGQGATLTCERRHPLLSVWPLRTQYKEHRSHLPGWRNAAGAIASIYP